MTEHWMIRATRRITARACVLGIALTLVGASVPRTATAEDVPAADKTPSKWEFEFMPYGWLAGTFGSATVKGNTVQVKATFSDLYGLLEDGNAFAGMGYLAVSYDRFSFFTDSMGGYAEVAVNETIPTQLCNLTIRARNKARFVIADFGVGYRLGQWSLPRLKRPLTLGVYAGSRYMHIASRLNATGGVVGGVERSANVKDTFDWADPMIGVRWSLPVLDSVSVDFRGDIGGFGASSDLIWGLVGGAKYWLPWTPMSLNPYLSAGYRIVGFDRGSSADNVNLQMRGPFVGAGFVY
jgi:hypothetical protein